MSSSDLPKLGAEPTKIGHVFWKQCTLKIKVFKKFYFIFKLISSQKKKSERLGWFSMPKNDFESTLFENFEEVVHNFGRSDDDMI